MKNLITKFLNLEPDDIQNIDVFSQDNQVFARITLTKKFYTCPKCGIPTKRIHDYNQRTISHAILDGIDTTIVYNQRRYFCPSCKKSFIEDSPFVHIGKRISKYTVLRIMKELKNPRMTFSMVASNCHVSVSSVMRVFDEYVGIPTRPLPTILCIDEVYTVKYTQKVYACVLVDFQSNEIYDLLPSRKKHDLANHFTKIDKKYRDQVLYVSIDMWEPYRDIARLYFKNAKVCVDNFHVVKLINYAFTKVRIQVMRQYDVDSDEYYLLKKFSWLLNMKYDDIDLHRRIHIHKNISYFFSKDVLAIDILNFLLNCDCELEIAYALKEAYNDINKRCNSETIEVALNRFIEDMIIFNIEEFNSVVSTFKNWKQEIINSFDIIDHRRISNGPIESVNSRIKLIKRNANGYRNFIRFRKRVLYSLNKNSFINF
ncbi:ISL3 family transposase [Massilicoli timonensis]|uniref:ISL3 family transposase n=1 Tax=Massilicoli timonensis TaxID=2015901 RepID=UPI000C83102A|nr:ISL3 family transposase [Massilicoli timonensis]